MRLRDNNMSAEYQSLVAVGIDEGARDLSQVRIDGLDVRVLFTGHTQTWQPLDVLDLRGFTAPCNSSRSFTPAMAVSNSRRELVLFGFGPQPICHQLLVWRNRQTYTVSTEGGENVPHFMHAIAVLNLPEDGNESLRVISFGGMSCSHWPCDNVVTSNSLWEIVISFRSGSYSGVWKAVVPASSCSPISPPARLLSSVMNINDSSLLLHGGFKRSLLEDAFEPLADAWFFDRPTKCWRNMNLPQPAIVFPNVPGPLSDFGSFHYEAVFVSKTSTLLIAYNSTVHHTLSRNASDHETLIACDINMTTSAVVCDRLEPSSSADVFRTRFSMIAGDFVVYMVHFRSEETLRISSPRRGAIAPEVRPFPGSQDLKMCYVGCSNCLSSNPAVHTSSHYPYRRQVFLIGGSCRNRPLFTDGSGGLGIWILQHSHSGEIVYRLRRIYPGPSSEAARGLSIFILRQKLILHGGLFYSERFKYQDAFTPSVWCLDLNGYYWLSRRLVLPGVEPPSRADHVVIPHNETSFIIYGGISAKFRALGDIWLVQFEDIGSCLMRWQNLSVPVGGVQLPAMYGHRAAAFEGRNFVYGGTSGNPHDVHIHRWLFEISVAPDGSTVHVSKFELRPAPNPRKYHSLSPYTADALLLLGGELMPSLVRTGSSFLITVPNATKSNSTAQITVTPFFTTEPTQGHFVEGNLILSGLLGATKGGDAVICSSDVGTLKNNRQCPRGQERTQRNTCEVCQEGFVSETLEGMCQPCAKTLVTNGTGAWECLDPPPCTPLTCHGHGQCIVSHHLQAVCKCSFGFLARDNCYFPYVYVSQVAVAVSLLLAVGCIMHMRTYLRQKVTLRKKEAQLTAKHIELAISRKKIKQLNRGARINWSSLNLIEKLATGNSNDVWLAELGELKVVVKTLPLTKKNCNSQFDAFSQEAEFLRSIRHPNIVTFLGAGTERLSGRPFIVTEYVSRGSLYGILHDPSTELCHFDRLRFGVDISKGMAYLHASRPPRIHRDLKSPNLLVTDKWTVKIADFGTARFLAPLEKDDKLDTNTSKPRIWNNLISRMRSWTRSNTSLALPLLRSTESTGEGDQNHSYQRSLSGVMTSGIGTYRWRSPESLQNLRYCEKTDVYR